MLPEGEDGSMAPLFTAMERLASGLRNFLSVLDSDLEDAEHLMPSWQACCKAFDDFRLLNAGRQGFTPDELERYEDLIDELQRLNAVVTAAVGRERDQLLERLDLAHRADRSLAYYASTEASGTTCDVAG